MKSGRHLHIAADRPTTCAFVVKADDRGLVTPEEATGLYEAGWHARMSKASAQRRMRLRASPGY